MNKPPDNVIPLPVDFKRPEECLEPGESIIGHDHSGHPDKQNLPAALPHDLEEK